MVLFITNTLKALTEHEEITYFEIRQRTVPLSYYAKVSFEDMQYVSNLQKGNDIFMFDYRLIIPGKPLSIQMTDITDLRLEVADNEIMEPMKDFIEKFTKIYLLESFTQSDMHIPMKQHNRPEGTARCSVSNGITAE